MCDQQRLRPACAYAQSDQSLCLSFEYSMTVEILTEHYLVFLSLKGGCTCSSETILLKKPHCWKSHAAAYLLLLQVSECWVCVDSGFVLSSLAINLQKKSMLRLLQLYCVLSLLMFLPQGAKGWSVICSHSWTYMSRRSLVI